MVDRFEIEDAIEEIEASLTSPLGPAFWQTTADLALGERVDRLLEARARWSANRWPTDTD